MDNEAKDHNSPTHTGWQQFKTCAAAELRWLAETSGMVVVTLALGRLIQKLGLDISHLTGTSWEELVKKWLHQDKQP